MADLRQFLLPDVSAQIHGFFAIVPAVAEIWMLLYLLVIGVRSPRRAQPGIPDSALLVPIDPPAVTV